ncbi:hypothetical protein AAFC00_006426 [Neodothiora populina]|uniref:Uncharacterized protein n=1 Tax=Neodothiora populina TaxID=2781224 RepID=A0ABR3P5C7_9PEZI
MRSFISAVAAVALATTSFAAPTASQIKKRYAEGTYWNVTNLDYFHSDDLSVGSSYLTFTFSDDAPQAALTTTCTVKPLDDSDAAVMYDTYHPCDGFETIEGTSLGFGVSVRFHGGSNLALNRTYVDTTVDQYPYAQFVSVQGHGSIESSEGVPGFNGENGYHEIVDYLRVDITQIA